MEWLVQGRQARGDSFFLLFICLWFFFVLLDRVVCAPVPIDRDFAIVCFFFVQLAIIGFGFLIKRSDHFAPQSETVNALIYLEL